MHIAGESHLSGCYFLSADGVKSRYGWDGCLRRCVIALIMCMERVSFACDAFYLGCCVDIGRHITCVDAASKNDRVCSVKYRYSPEDNHLSPDDGLQGCSGFAVFVDDVGFVYENDRRFSLLDPTFDDDRRLLQFFLLASDDSHAQENK